MSKGDWRRPASPEVALEEKVKRFLEMDGIAKEDTSVGSVDVSRRIDPKTKISKSRMEEYMASLKPKGYYNIPELLDCRRLEYGIPNEAFESFPLFDRVFIWQVSDVDDRETYVENGTIVMTDHAIKARRDITPRGVLVAAGLKATDALRSSGCEIGHIVKFQKLAPFMMEFDSVFGDKLTLTVLRDGDVISSEDLATAIREKRSKVYNHGEPKGEFDHRIMYEDGNSSGKKIDEYYDGSY